MPSEENKNLIFLLVHGLVFVSIFGLAMGFTGNPLLALLLGGIAAGIFFLLIYGTLLIGLLLFLYALRGRPQRRRSRRKRRKRLTSWIEALAAEHWVLLYVLGSLVVMIAVNVIITLFCKNQMAAAVITVGTGIACSIGLAVIIGSLGSIQEGR